MKKIIFIIFGIIFFPAISLAQADFATLSIPYTSEIPDGKWVAPWNNACEEASIVMVEQYYLGNKNKTINRTTAKNLMWPLFKYEDKKIKTNADTDAKFTKLLIDEYTTFDATIKDNPTLEDIKEEISAGHPVITLHYGFGLKNPLIPFRRTGSSYHVMVLKGYDDAKKEFIVNDPGNHTSGLDYRYKYDIIMGTLHDFNYKTKKVDGPARVLFTQPKQLVKIKGGSSIYLVKDDAKHIILNPSVFKTRNWKWSAVKNVTAEWLGQFTTGTPIGELK